MALHAPNFRAVTSANLVRTLRSRSARARCRGMTLLELLVVVAILAAVATIGVQALDLTGRQSQERLVMHEMRQIADGIQQFYQDTGFYPNTGPFTSMGSLQYDGVTLGSLDSPANMVQLFVEPALTYSDTNSDGTWDTLEDPIMPWNPDYGRGWRGPYVTDFGEGNVSISGTFPGETGSIVVMGIADPFEREPDGDYYIWSRPYIIDPEVEIKDAPTWRGRPYLLFLANDPSSEMPDCVAPCLVSMGPDGVFQPREPVNANDPPRDDIVINLIPSLTN